MWHWMFDSNVRIINNLDEDNNSEMNQIYGLAEGEANCDSVSDIPNVLLEQYHETMNQMLPSKSASRYVQAICSTLHHID